ncbi:MAG: hypothetical protein RL220_368, partial [Bacteroidota bacterium]
MSEPVRLTQYSKSSGCGCKIAPDVLSKILNTTDEFPTHPGLIAGNEGNEDAAVFDAGLGEYIISTVDFFMPVVDDAYEFGKIAASNALSDIYAMGGSPVMAVAILGWPVEKIPASEAARVIEGARFICRVAGIPLAGGHSVDSAEPIFGLSVTGKVKPENLRRNNTIQEGDLLYLTKPIGSGIISSAAKRGVADSEHIETCIRYMISLNHAGAALGQMQGVHAMTDVTGFGLLGHAIEMVGQNDLSIEISYNEIPLMPGVKELVGKFIYPDITTRNFSAFSSRVNQLSAEQLFVLCDPQTSGGLLVAVDPASESDYLGLINQFAP